MSDDATLLAVLLQRILCGEGVVIVDEEELQSVRQFAVEVDSQPEGIVNIRLERRVTVER